MTLTGKHSRRWGWDRKRCAPRALLGFALLLLAGCSDRGDTIAVPTSTTSPAPASTSAPAATSTTQDAATEIVARYQKFWEARFDANQPPPNPDSSALAEYATGQQLDQVKSETRTNLRRASQFVMLPTPSVAALSRSSRLEAMRQPFKSALSTTTSSIGTAPARSSTPA